MQWQVPRVSLHPFVCPVWPDPKMFIRGEIVCEEPLLTVDRQMGLNVVHPEGKHAKTVFTLIRYDENTDTSVVHCKPLTGRCQSFLSILVR